MQKKANLIEQPDFRKRKTKDFWNVFCSKMETIVYGKLRLEKSVKMGANSSLVEKNRHNGSIIPNCICGSEDCLTI